MNEAWERHLSVPKDESADPCISRPAKLSHIAFSFTNHCNLRCVYCPQGTHPDEFHANTPREQIDTIIDYARRNKIAKISIGYYGETMLVKGWEQAVKPLFDQGIRLNLVSNFSKVMTPDEVAAVSRFDEVQISIDSVDMAVLRQVRKAVDVRTILYNTHLIRAHVIRNRLRMPQIIWTAVLTDRVAAGMPDLVAMAVSSGVRSINCVEVAYIASTEQREIRHLVDAPDGLFIRGFDAVHQARRLALLHGATFALGGAERMDRRARALLDHDSYERIARVFTGPEDLDPARTIFIYGAGSAGQALRATLPDGQVRAFIDSNHDGVLDGLPVLSFERYRGQASPDDLILIGSSFEDEIENRLLEHGFENYRRAAPKAVAQPAPAEVPAESGQIRRRGIQGDYFFSGDALDDVPPGMTRLCETPWTEMFLDPKGEAYACCFRGQVMGKLRDGAEIDDIMAGEPYRRLRRQLLTGEGLDPECRLCSVHAIVTPQAMREHVSRLLESALAQDTERSTAS